MLDIVPGLLMCIPPYRGLHYAAPVCSSALSGYLYSMFASARMIPVSALLILALMMPSAGHAAFRMAERTGSTETTVQAARLSLFQRLALSIVPKKRYKYQYYSRNENNKLGVISVICASAGALDIAALFIFGPTAGAATVIAMGLGWPALGIAAIVFGILGIRRDRTTRPAVAGMSVGITETSIFAGSLAFLELLAAIFKK